jgi:hypothetical protein
MGGEGTLAGVDERSDLVAGAVANVRRAKLLT